MNTWKCTEFCMGGSVSCEIKLVHDNTPDKCMTNGEPVKWQLQNTSSNSVYTANAQITNATSYTRGALCSIKFLP